MGKLGKARKRRRLEDEVHAGGHLQRFSSTIDEEACVADNSGEDVEEVADERLMLDAIAALDMLGRRLDHYSSKACKTLRTALFPLIKAQQARGAHFEPPPWAGHPAPSDAAAEAVLGTAAPAATALLRVAASTFAGAAGAALLAEPEHKAFRRALHPLVVEQYRRDGKPLPALEALGLSGRISTAFRNRDWAGALALLREMEGSGERPKLGAMQRWVRDCDLATQEQEPVLPTAAPSGAAAAAGGGAAGGAGAATVAGAAADGDDAAAASHGGDAPYARTSTSTSTSTARTPASAVESCAGATSSGGDAAAGAAAAGAASDAAAAIAAVVAAAVAGTDSYSCEGGGSTRGGNIALLLLDAVMRAGTGAGAGAGAAAARSSAVGGASTSATAPTAGVGSAGASVDLTIDPLSQRAVMTRMPVFTVMPRWDADAAAAAGTEGTGAEEGSVAAAAGTEGTGAEEGSVAAAAAAARAASSSAAAASSAAGRALPLHDADKAGITARILGPAPAGWDKAAALAAVRVISHVPGPQRRPPSEDDLRIYMAAPGTFTFDDAHHYARDPQRGDGEHEAGKEGAAAAAASEAGKEGAAAAAASEAGKEAAAAAAAASDAGSASAAPSGAPSSALGSLSPHASLIRRHDVPSVPGAFLLSDVLSPRECGQLLHAAEGIGYARDGIDGIGAVVLLADDSLLAPILARVRHLLPQHIGGCALRGINARLRFFRYGAGAVYRPHIDGSWPGSGLDAEGKLTDDAFPGECVSRLTFLIYLNGGFDGGATTFFLPSPAGRGHIQAYGVQPQQGAVLCFPHGEGAGSLVHEGSSVAAGGAKYIIRTDVLYATRPSAPAAAGGTA